MTPLFDPGLQPQRTELAWRRTALVVVIGGLVAARLIPASLGDPWWALCGVAGAAGGVALWEAGRRRSRRSNDDLCQYGDRAPIGGGGQLLAPAILATAAGAGAMTLIIVRIS